MLGEFVFNPSRTNDEHPMMMMTRESTNTKLFRTTARDENENESKVGIKRTMPTPARVMVVSGDGKDGIFIRVRSIHML